MAYGFGLIMTDIVWKIFVIVWNIPLYFLTGFQQTASNFFIWFVVVYIEHLALSMFFRSVAVFSSNMYRAVLPVGIFFNMYVLYTGLYVPPPQMQAWLGWLRYLNVSIFISLSEANISLTWSDSRFTTVSNLS
jgi:hypothetical protein